MRVRSGTAAAGASWQYFDLGHGFCTYSFFDQCPHRMACARCDFYLPKDSTKAQLLEAHGEPAADAVGIPLTDDERAAVEDGTAAVERSARSVGRYAYSSWPDAARVVGRAELHSLGACHRQHCVTVDSTTRVTNSGHNSVENP